MGFGDYWEDYSRAQKELEAMGYPTIQDAPPELQKQMRDKYNLYDRSKGFTGHVESAVKDVGREIESGYRNFVEETGLNKALPFMFPSTSTEEAKEVYELYEPALMAAGGYLGAQALPGLVGMEGAGGAEIMAGTGDVALTGGGNVASIIPGISNADLLKTGLGIGAEYLMADEAADVAGQAAQADLQAQREVLDYLREVDRLPREFREQALSRLGAIYGMAPEGYAGPTRDEFISGLEESPLYEAMMGGLEAGEEAIMRRAGATGGLRSGNVQDALSRQASDLRNQALLTTYNEQMGGLRGLAGLPTQTANIANTMGNMGNIRAQGITAQGQARQQGLQGMSNMFFESGII